MTISQQEITGGLSFAAAGLANHMVGWSYAEGSEGFLPAYKVHVIEDAEELAAELVSADRWTAVRQGDVVYGYLIAPSSEQHKEEVIVEVGVSDFARKLVEDAQSEPDDDEPADDDEAAGTPEELQRIIDAVPHHDLKAADRITNTWSLGQFSDDDLDNSFDEFRKEFPGQVPNSDEAFDTFIEAARSTKSLTKVTVAASQYTGRLNALRWLSKEMYLEEEAFQNEP